MKTIKAIDLEKKLKTKEVVLIDVREPGEYKTECIEGSILIPLGEVSIDRLPSSDLPIVIHCRSGVRSRDACNRILADNPGLDISNLEGGIESWKAAGFPVKKMGRSVLPLDGQMRLTAGTILLLGLALGAYVNPYFYLIPAFIGVGLVQSGITGWCGMIKILSMMPWNK